MAFPASSGAATQLGETFPAPDHFCDPFATNLQSGSPNSSYAAPFPGVITSWSYLADGNPPPVKLKVARHLGGTSYLILAESALIAVAPNALHTQPARIPVNAGDFLGIYTAESGSADCGRSAPSYMSPRQNTDTPVGTPATFSNVDALQINISAVLEPDCDNDGFGDETQDQNLLACPPGPNATITSGPADKVKSKKNRTTATFTFSADEPDAAFDCALDGKQEFEPCVSPLTVTVRRGKHSFTIQATDAGGNQGAVVTDTWKVKRKKKK